MAPAAVPRSPGAAPRGRPAAGQQVEIRTDLYTAPFDSAGGVIAQIALAKHRDPSTRRSPTSRSSATPSARSSRSRVCSARACPTTAPPTRCCRARASSRRAQDTLELKLAATAPAGDKVVQTLTFHRGSYVIDAELEITNARQRADHPVRVLPAHARHQDAGQQNSMAPVVLYRAGRLQRGRQVQEGRVRRDSTSSPPTPSASRRSPRRRQRLDRHDRALLRRRLAAADEKKLEREFYTRKLDNGLYAAGVIVPTGADRPGRDRQRHGAAVRRPAGPGRAREAREGARPRRRLRHLHRASRRRCSAAASGCTA